MVRCITQVLMGLMFLFGAVMLTLKGFYHLSRKKVFSALYVILISVALLALAVLALQSAYSGLGD